MKIVVVLCFDWIFGGGDFKIGAFQNLGLSGPSGARTGVTRDSADVMLTVSDDVASRVPTQDIGARLRTIWRLVLSRESFWLFYAVVHFSSRLFCLLCWHGKMSFGYLMYNIMVS